MANRRYKKKRRRSSVASALLTLFIVLFILGSFNWVNNSINFFDNTDFSISDFTSHLPKIFSSSSESSAAPEDYNLSVTFLDVGQGNCMLAESDGHYMLIDGGDGDHSSFVVSYLKQHDITVLDYVIISHYDADHLSGIIGVMYNFDVEMLLSPDYNTDSKIYNSYINCITTQNITPVHPKPGDTYTFGSSHFQIMCPNNYNYENENNFSLGIRLTDDFHSFLILGDAEKQSEADITKNGLTLKSDVYLVNHHGSSSSTSEKFLSAVNPDYAIISVGANNKYGHPTDKTLAVLASHNVDVLRTDEKGTITIYSTNEKLSFVYNTN